jgi:glucokinase
MGIGSTRSLSSSNNSRSDGLFIGVDIGGTKIAAGIVDREGRIIVDSRRPMVPDRGANAGLTAVAEAISAVFAEAGPNRPAIQGIGICSPGPLDPIRGVIINPPNLPCWRNFPLVSEVAKLYEIPVVLENDANAAALAEVLWGSARRYGNVFYATIGTGIGTGIVVNGGIYHGRTGSAGEGGHMSIDHRGPRCGCGKAGCIEALAAGPAIAKRAQAKLLEDSGAGQSAMINLAGGDASAVTCEIVEAAYNSGDSLAKEVLMETSSLLSLWLSNVVDLLEPEVIVIGGGVSKMLSPFFENIRTQMIEHCLNSRADEIPLLMAHYGAQAGIAGAAAVCATHT